MISPELGHDHSALGVVEGRFLSVVSEAGS